MVSSESTVGGKIPACIPVMPRGGAVVWQPDDDVESCNECLSKFTLVVRRHHCRICGLIFCDSCCPKSACTSSGSLSSSSSSGILLERACYSCNKLPSHYSSVQSLWEIGSGTYGTVNCGLLPDGRWCAVKHLSVSGSAAGTIREFHKEIDVMRSLTHPNIVRYFGSHLDDSTVNTTDLFIFIEYVSGGSISELLQRLNGAKLPASASQKYSKDILQGLQYLHKHGIAHRDIKCQNILVSPQTGTAKVADFGSAWTNAKRKVRQATTFVGTPHWMAPEVLVNPNHEGYNPMKADIWSFACTIVEIHTGSPAWPSQLNPMMLILEIEKSSDSSWPTGFQRADLPTALVEVLSKCFLKDPSKRLSLKELSKFDFFVNDPENISKTNNLASNQRLQSPLGTDNFYPALLKTGSFVSVKRLVEEVSPRNPNPYSELLREMSLLKEVNHENIHSLYGSKFYERAEGLELQVYLEFVSGGPLDALLPRLPGGCLPDSVVRAYSRQLLTGLVYLHQKGIAHRGLTTSCVLVSLGSGLVKITNFSEATDPFMRSARQKAVSLCGLPQYIAPEVIEADEGGYEATKPDIWSLGCIVSEMHTGLKPWLDYSCPLTAFHAVVSTNSWPNNIDPDTLPIDLADFLSNCFQRKPEKRSSAMSLLAQKYASLRMSRYD
eukprot:TRINITY_DN544_c2_g1_i1.p1 TRINITY_DN544_c2_g1~~TRINITY_DN544_c2_g1_i1.p1  ORF type:complete len:664 (+),score=101.02 TRINITY_DN544_c2_g1_i1:130-2121(+)